MAHYKQNIFMYKIPCYAKDPFHPPVARVDKTVYSPQVASEPTLGCMRS